MSEEQNLLEDFNLNLSNNRTFNLFNCNDFILSKIIDQVSTEITKDIFFITKNSKECKLLIEYIEEIWKKKTFYLGSDILKSQTNDLNNRSKLLNILFFLEKNNRKIKFIEQENLYLPFEEGINKKKILIDISKNSLNRESLILKLENFEYRRSEFIERLGDFSVRGSIVDIFAPSCKSPIRVEFFDDKISSINSFDIENERRFKEKLHKVEVVTLKESDSGRKDLLVADYIENSIVFSDCIIEDSQVNSTKAKNFIKKNKIIYIDPLKKEDATEGYEFNIQYLKEEASSSISSLMNVLDKEKSAEEITLIADAQTINNLKVDLKAQHLEKILFLNGFLRKPFILRNPRKIFLSFTNKEEGKKESSHSEKYAKKSFKLSGFNDLKEGDLVIHKDFGLCFFNGIKNKLIENMYVDFIECKFSHNDLLLIPIDRISLIQKYIGSSDGKALDTLRTKAWSGKVKKARRVAQTTAREILSLYAQRKSVKGFPFKLNNQEIAAFEETFEFEETVDQKNAILDTYKDMQSSSPMDRLICGDVGFGKTEVALRASFLSAINLKQSVLVAPTTLLAHQHLRTFIDRFKEFPIRVEGVTRFTRKKELDKIIEDSISGKIDILIGTHKIFSKQIKLKNLGLIIIDEEHKFGVSDKEKIKQIKKGIDSLSISATPIPRTLQLSLSGLREISLLSTPPKERLSIETYIEEFDASLIKKAISYELARNGRVFFVHNEIASIEKIHKNIMDICPGVEVKFIHGQMRGDAIEETLQAFIDGKVKVLITTTIIEAGLDIRQANTMIINNAHKFGLSDLYQLRGRIGRGSNKGKAFLLIPNQEISETAKKRLNAIRKLTRLGSGFNIAMEDLEIRGAGNLFGTQQSGNIFDVGIEFYLELLEKEINNIKDTAMNEEEEVEVIANQNIYIPDNYIESAERRLYYYKKISLIGSTNDSLELLEELLDKFGVIPNQVQNLIYITLIKIESQRLGIYKLIFKKESVIFLSKKIKKIKEFQVEIKKIAINPPEIYKLLSETINIENMLKSNYEIVDGRFIIKLN